MQKQDGELAVEEMLPLEDLDEDAAMDLPELDDEPSGA
jgi:hypothetical protein